MKDKRKTAMEPAYNFTKVFAAACLGMLLFGIVMISLGSILPELMTKYGLDERQAGGLASLLPFGVLAGSLFFGPVVDRYSYRGLLIISALLILAGLEGIAFAGDTATLNLSLLLIGIGGGAINGGTNALVVDISADQPGSRGANLSFLGVFFGVGALGTPAVLGALAYYFPYDRILAGIGLFILVPVLFFFVIRFPQPKQERGIPFSQWTGLLRNANLLLLSFFLFFQSAVEGIANNWTTVFLQDQTAMAPANALYALSLLVLGMTLTRLALAGLLRRLRPYVVLAASLIWKGGPTGATTGLALLGVGVAAGFPVLLGYIGDLFSAVSGTAFSIALSIALFGNILGNYAMGMAGEAYGLSSFPLLMAGALAMQILLLGLLIRRQQGKADI